MQRAALVALTVPLLCAAAALLWVIRADADAGAAARQPLNIAEAAGMANAADVVRRLRLREDPHRIYPVRPEILTSTVTRATAPEAALWSRQVELLRLLDREGALLGGSVRQELTCLALDIGTSELAEYLTPGGAECEPGAALARLEARSEDNQ